MSNLRYPVPWREVIGLTPHIRRGTRTSVDQFTASIAEHIRPEPLVDGKLPDDPRFVLAANHYQREGLWILHTATVLTRLVRDRYGPGDPPVRWMVTANWPPLRLGSFCLPSPGDWPAPITVSHLSPGSHGKQARLSRGARRPHDVVFDTRRPPQRPCSHVVAKDRGNPLVRRSASSLTKSVAVIRR